MNLEKVLKDKNVSKAQLTAIIDQIQNPPENTVKRHNWGKRHIKIGLMGDTHIGSRFANYGVLNDIFKRFKAEGVQAVYHMGDITEGYNMRPGHSYEVDLHGADEQVRGVLERLPDIGKPIYFINGDHDHSHFKQAGVDIGKQISKGRKDLHYLGFFHARVDLGSVILEMGHPAKGSAYAISYYPQKIVDAMSGGSKPNILALGHTHKIEYLFYRNIHCFQTGTTQSQTDWMRRMNLSAHLGAWVLDVYMKKDGTIDKLKQELLAYY